MNREPHFDENEVLRQCMSPLNEEVPDMPENFHAQWTALVKEDAMKQEETRKVAPMRRWTRILSVAAALVFVVFSRVAYARYGHALRGIRDNETRMVALGYPVYRLKLAGFVAAGAVAGLAGGLLASHNAFVSPGLMHWTQSALLLVMVMLGGAGRRWGAALGVALWLTLEEVLKMYTDYWHWPLGLLLLLIVFHAPQGLAGLFGQGSGGQGADATGELDSAVQERAGREEA